LIKLDNEKKNYKWRLIMTKSFDFNLPSAVINQSLEVSFDVIDIIAHNMSEKNKKISLDTCLTRPETLIFNCKQKQSNLYIILLSQSLTKKFNKGVQSSLNLAKHDEVNGLVEKLGENKKLLVFVVCLIQGLLQSRQNLTNNGLHKWFQWGLCSIIQTLNCIHQYEPSDFTLLPQYLMKVLAFMSIFFSFLQYF